MTRTRWTHTLGAIALVALGLTGACGSSNEGDGAQDASLEDTSPSDTADTSPSDTASPDTTEGDTETPDTTTSDTTEPDTGELDAGGPPALNPRLPDTTALGERRGLRVVRGLIHSHSIHSHDACDGMPRLEGDVFNEACNEDWREGVCLTRQDFIFNTDHEELAAFTEWEDLLLVRGDDEVLRDAEQRAVANRLACPDGFRPLILPGGEFGMMPVGMVEHLEAESDEARSAMYDEVTPERAASLKELGAVVLQAHTEFWTADALRPLGLDGFEIYNLHANIDPRIREDQLGLDGLGFIDELAPFVERDNATPDLALLGFFAENQPALEIFDTLVAEGQHLTGTAGTDSHQNSLPFLLPDDERADSFRRMMRFFSNHLLVPPDYGPDDLRDALRLGRAYVAFETLGTPTGFDFLAEGDDGATWEMGDRVPLSASPTLRVVAPEALGYPETGPVTLRIIKARAGGGVEVAATGEGALEWAPQEAGAYRAEIRVVPSHLEPWLGATSLSEREFVWIYANPIYVE